MDTIPKCSGLSQVMRLPNCLFLAPLLAGLNVAFAAAGWSFDDAALTVQAKGEGVRAGAKHKYVFTTSHIFAP